MSQARNLESPPQLGQPKETETTGLKGGKSSTHQTYTHSTPNLCMVSIKTGRISSKYLRVGELSKKGSIPCQETDCSSITKW